MRFSCVVIFGVLLAAVSDAAVAETPDELRAVRERVEAYRLVRESHAALQQAEAMMLGDGLGLEVELPDEKERAMLQRAIDLAQQALVHVPELTEAHLVIANAYWTMDELDQTDRHYSMLLELDPARDDVLSARVGLRIERKDWEGAKADVRRLRELDSSFADSAERDLESALNP